MRISPLIKVWDGERIIKMGISYNLATQDPPTEEEEELVRIFHEYEQMKKYLEWAGNMEEFMDFMARDE